MRLSRVRQIVRQFRENGMKLLLENPDNARELLALAGRDVVKLIDFERLRIIKTTFVARDYRHMATDVVLAAPVRRGKVAGRRRQRILPGLFILSGCKRA